MKTFQPPKSKDKILGFALILKVRNREIAPEMVLKYMQTCTVCVKMHSVAPSPE